MQFSCKKRQQRQRLNLGEGDFIGLILRLMGLNAVIGPFFFFFLFFFSSNLVGPIATFLERGNRSYPKKQG